MPTTHHFLSSLQRAAISRLKTIVASSLFAVTAVLGFPAYAAIYQIDVTGTITFSNLSAFALGSNYSFSFRLDSNPLPGSVVYNQLTPTQLFYRAYGSGNSTSGVTAPAASGVGTSSIVDYASGPGFSTDLEQSDNVRDFADAYSLDIRGLPSTPGVSVYGGAVYFLETLAGVGTPSLMNGLGFDAVPVDLTPRPSLVTNRFVVAYREFFANPQGGIELGDSLDAGVAGFVTGISITHVGTVPLPGTLALMGVILATLCVTHRRRRVGS
jgi:hypothetical protein